MLCFESYSFWSEIDYNRRVNTIQYFERKENTMVNINAIRYFLYEEAGVVWCLISIFLSIIAFLSGRATMKWIFAVSIFIITIVLVGNYIGLKNIHSVELPQDSPEKVQGNSYVPEQTQDPLYRNQLGEQKLKKVMKQNILNYCLKLLVGNILIFGFIMNILIQKIRI